MANPGVGSKFVSVNLNKSYGQTPSPLGPASASRIRPGSHGSGGGAGGMVVLSRTRSSLVGTQKSGHRLSVPPPLNLPSLRKEHERFDSASSGTGLGGSGSSGSGSRPTSSGMGWTKPGPSALPEKDSSAGSGGGAALAVDAGDSPFDSGTRGNSVYVPPSARSCPNLPVATAVHTIRPVEKVVFLRGEDFPSLQATTMPAASGPSQKQKDSFHQKQKLKVSEEVSEEQSINNSHSRPVLHMRPQMRSSLLSIGNGSNENNTSTSHGSSSLIRSEPSRKHNEYFPDPLPLVRFNHRSDWADDERDTGHGLPDREDRGHGYSRSEAHWDREFDIPRGGVPPPRTSVHDFPNARGLHDDEAGNGKVSSGDTLKGGDLYGRDIRTPSREGRDGSNWRSSPRLNEGYGARETVNDRNGTGARPFNMNRTPVKETRYNQSAWGDNGRDVFYSGVGKKDMGYGQGGRQNGNHVVESFSNRGFEHNSQDRGDSSSRYRGDFFQNSSVPKTSFLGSKGLTVNDPILNFGREKRSFSNSGKPYREDSLLKDFDGGSGFDGRDPFTGGVVGMLKRKKDVVHQADFHDPVRESFEAELERVQQMQEQERQRIMEEQSRALELARKEEEEREKLVREEEERRRRLEEEAREAAWRAEQERLETMRRAEEQRVAREDEKRRMLLEDERRKEAARLKLLELEARIARRRAEAVKDDKFHTVGVERMSDAFKEKDIPRVADVVRDWEDGERMVERITNSASSDSSSLNRSLETGSRPHSSRDGTSVLLDRGKATNSWRRDVFDNGNSTIPLQDQENGYRSPRRDVFGAGRAFNRKEFNGNPGFMSARMYYKGGISESPMDDFSHLREHHRWNFPGDGDHYSHNSEIDPDFHENPTDKFGDMGWGQDRSHGIPHASYPERLYQNTEADGISSFGRSRHSMRQPRVLPPPQASMHRSPFRGETGHHGSSAFLNSEMRYHHAPRKSEPSIQTGFDNGYQEKVEQSGMVDVQQQPSNLEEQKLEKITTRRCDSQSSLSVSSPPNSPGHLSHDDLDVSVDSPVLPGTAEDKAIHLSDNELVVSDTESGKAHVRAASGSVSPGEEWAIQNDEELQEQEEYDEEDGYQEEDEAHEGYNENIDLAQGFDNIHLEEKGASCKIDHLVLGFDDGVEVGLPNDEFERSSGNEEKALVIQQVSVNAVEEPGSSDGLGGDELNFQPVNNSLEMRMDNSSNTFQQTEKGFQDLVIQPMNSSHTTASSDGSPLDGVEISSSSSLLAQQPVTSSFKMAVPSPSAHPVVSSVSSVPNQAEVPVKLQFGLFSGPSLIPSPVPAIQIGSIPMPLHLHPQVGPSITQMHPSQPPFFQFGQLRYTSSISQGILPLAPQSMSFVQPNVSAHYSLNQNIGGPMHNQAGQDTSVQNPQMASISMDSQPALVTKLLDLSQENVSKGVNVRENAENESQCHAEITHLGEKKTSCDPCSQIEDERYHNLAVKKNYKSVAYNRESQGLLQADRASSQLIYSERALSGSKAPGPVYCNKGRKFMYTVRNSGLKMPSPAPEAPYTDSGGFQRRPRRHIRRTEFRVRENTDSSRQTEDSHNYSGVDEKSNFSEKLSGVSSRTGAKRNVLVNKPPKQPVEFESLASGSSSSRFIDSEGKSEKGLGKQPATRRLTSSLGVSRSGEGNLKRNSSSEEDVNAPLQSGVVRVFKQPGIETPSDEDDFIEVRSKRQMLNDRREQREKEIKAKSRVMKAPRKPRSVSQGIMVSTGSNKMTMSLSGEAANNVHSESVVTDNRGLRNVEISAGFTTTTVSQPLPLPPIGTPSVNIDAQIDIRSQTMKSLQMGSTAVISGDGADIGTGLPFETKHMVMDNAQTSLGCWGNARINQQVMALTQTQLDEAMKPGRFDTHVASIGDHNSTVPSKQASPLLTQDKSFPSVASPLNSLLAGEKIQFGAVTSPTILPPSSRSVSNGIGPPGSCRLDIPMSHGMSVAESDCTLFFEKEKHPDESCIHLEDPEAEAEAEAAASAIAVAAISSDEIGGNMLGACSVVSDTKSVGGADIEGLTSRDGGVGDQPLTSQSRAEESLTVALPADLSVETPALSLWPPLPSPQSSNQMLSHFPGGRPSHFPCYEMNPMLGGPIFAFGPHDESAGTQLQSHKNNASSSGQLGPWQQCHSGVDSFYGPAAGFTGPYISPPSGIPGVQGPPHMVVYNHFAPVGQFGQVGLSFMGTTYIPSGKQPDWKHNPASSGMGVGEGDINNLNVVSAQRNPSNMPAPIQHLAPGSPLLPMASPLAMFDMAPFQSSPDMSVQARWSHVPASPLHSVPLSMPLQQQAEGMLPSQFSQGFSIDQSSIGNKFPEPNSSIPSDKRRNFSLTSDATASQFPDELGLVDPLNSTTNRVSAARPTSYNSQNENGKADNAVGKSSSRNTLHQPSSSSLSMSSAFKTPSSTQQYIGPTGYPDQRGGDGVSQKVSSGGEWPHRRIGGFQGRNQSSGTEKSFASTKIKQIYVAKPTTSGGLQQ